MLRLRQGFSGQVVFVLEWVGKFRNRTGLSTYL